MSRPRRIAVALSAALVASVGANLWQWWSAPWPLVREGDEALVQRALRDAASEPGAAEFSRFPIVLRTAAMECVELRSRSRRSDGSQVFCYDREGRLVEERLHGPSFP